MNEQVKKKPWRPDKSDMIFFAVVAAVILVLVLGSSPRTTKAVPSDATHLNVTSRSQCMACHGVNGVNPQPKGHTRADQCFQCHMQPKAWGKSVPK